MASTDKDGAETGGDFGSASTDLALMEHRAILGVERRLFYGNLAIAMIVATVMRFWELALAGVVVVHMLAMWTTVKHPDMFAIYLRYRKQADLYRSWVSGSPKYWERNRRPEGFGRI